MRSAWRRARGFVADLLDRIREPGWPRRIVVLAVLAGVLAIPYPLSITGDFEVISLRPLLVRTKIEGPLTELLVKMGDRVTEGQVVARLLDTELRLERAKIAAQLAEVEASLRLLQKGYRAEEIQIARSRVQALQADVALKESNLRRETALFEGGAVARARVDEATNAHAQARGSLDQAMQELKKLSAGYRAEEIAQASARVEQIKGELATIEQHLAWTEIKAPMAGEVVTPDHELQKLLGTVLPRGASIMELVEPRALVARVEVPESEFGDVALGQEVALRAFQFPDATFAGVVDAIEPQVTQASEFTSFVPVLTRIEDARWSLLRVHTKGRAKLALGATPLAYVLYRRVLRSTFVKVWSWY